jgi:translation initiation factor 2 beta subunit (eIF-2beta)/eIF-5
MNEIKDYISIMDNAIPNNLCEEIIKEYNKSPDWEEAGISHGSVNKEIRNCKIIGISLDTIINKNKDIRKKIDDDIFECAKKVMTKYNEKFTHTNISKDTGYNLLKYEHGGFYTEHVDSFTNAPRTISCSFTLNDDFIGGDFSFFNNKITYPLKKGSAIIFPSNFMYPHSVLPIVQGTRYSIVTWFI